MVRNLSIIIPFYNKYDSLYQVHKELKLQINPSDEIIIIDDYSPNEKPDIKCDCTKVIRPSEKLTPHVYRLNSLRNLGLTSAKNDCCIILDPDCLPNPNFIENARKLFDPSVLFAGRIDRYMEDDSYQVDTRTVEKKSCWIDARGRLGEGILVWGGCMMFSKARTELVGWFDTDFNGSWGAEEHEFASRCFHSGMRLYYSIELAVTHLWHEKIRYGSPTRNVRLWNEKADRNKSNLNIISPYKPAVGVCVITMLRPDLIDQCLRAVFRNVIPLRVRLCVNGDDSEETKQALCPWIDKWAVEIIRQERTSPPKIRNDAARWAKERGYKYLVLLDDDTTVSTNGIINLIRAIESDDSIHACAGYLRDAKGKDMMLGGSIENNRFNYLSKKPGLRDVSWIGSGFMICRVDGFTSHDENYEMGWEDLDWAMEAIKGGKKLAVCGDAGAYHGVTFSKQGAVQYNNPPGYNKIRYDSPRHERMSNLFQSKWGFAPRMGTVIDK